MTTKCPTDKEIYIANALSLGVGAEAIAKTLKIKETEVGELKRTFNTKCEAIAKYHCGRVAT